VELAGRAVDGGGEVGEAFDWAAVDLLDNFVAEVFVAHGVRPGQYAADKNNLSAVARQLTLVSVEVDEVQGCLPRPVRAPFTKVLTGQLGKNESADNDEFGRGVENVGLADHA